MIFKNLIVLISLFLCAGQVQAMANSLPYKIQNMLGITNEKLFKAAQAGNCERIKQLIERGADANARESKQSATPIFFAVRNGQKEAVAVLVANGANVNIMAGSNSCIIPLFIAIMTENEEMVSVLVKSGADINNRDCIGFTTPMHFATFHGNGHEKMIPILVANGADINARNGFGFTPMHSAALYGHVNVIHMLAAHGADLNVRSNNGRTPIDVAKSQKIRDILKKIDEDRQKVASELRKQTSQS